MSTNGTLKWRVNHVTWWPDDFGGIRTNLAEAELWFLKERVISENPEAFRYNGFAECESFHIIIDDIDYEISTYDGEIYGVEKTE